MCLRCCNQGCCEGPDEIDGSVGENSGNSRCSWRIILVENGGRSKGNLIMNRLAGLTLIELLVVIAIIAVLMPILMPALSKGKAEAEKAFFAKILGKFGIFLHFPASHSSLLKRAPQA